MYTHLSSLDHKDIALTLQDLNTLLEEGLSESTQEKVFELYKIMISTSDPGNEMWLGRSTSLESAIVWFLYQVSVQRGVVLSLGDAVNAFSLDVISAFVASPQFSTDQKQRLQHYLNQIPGEPGSRTQAEHHGFVSLFVRQRYTDAMRLQSLCSLTPTADEVRHALQVMSA